MRLFENALFGIANAVWCLNVCQTMRHEISPLSLSLYTYICVYVCARARYIYVIHHPEQKRGGRVRPSLLMWCETKQNEKRKRWTEADSKNHLVSNKICHTHTQMFSTHIVTRTFPLHITYIITPTYTRISRTKSSPVSRKRCATSRSRGYRRSTNRAMAAEHWSEWMRQIKRGCEYFSWIFFQEPESIPFEMNQWNPTVFQKGFVPLVSSVLLSCSSRARFTVWRMGYLFHLRFLDNLEENRQRERRECRMKRERN